MPADMEEMLVFDIYNSGGMRARVLNYGATVTHLWVPDNEGQLIDVLLGYENRSGYLHPQNPYFNCTVGRYANRIASGRFRFNDTEYHLDTGGQKHCLHGGPSGMDKKFWQVIKKEQDTITLQLVSADGEGGFPGHLITSVTYQITEDNTLLIRYNTQCDQWSPVNLTFHGYFNLGSHDVSDHSLRVEADTVLEVDADLIPSGRYLNVGDSILDLRQDTRLDLLLEKGVTLDHCFVVNPEGLFKKVAVLSGNRITMEVATNLPGLQIYTGNGLNTDMEGMKRKEGYDAFAGICLEAQYYPDAPNHAHFPSPWLAPGAGREDVIVYRFVG